MTTRQKNLDSVYCECGAKIPIIPDLEVLARYIQAHAEMHEFSQTTKSKAKKEFDRIEQQLTEKVLLRVSGLECQTS